MSHTLIRGPQSTSTDSESLADYVMAQFIDSPIGSVR